MGYQGLPAGRFAGARERLDYRLVAPLRRCWHATLRMNVDRSGDAGWGESPWDHTWRRRRGILVTLSVVIVAVLAVGFVVRSVVLAASNYAAGKQALAAGRYDEAADKLSQTKILAILPYADSNSLYDQARRLSSQAASTAKQLQEKATQAAALYTKADTALRQQRYGDAIRLYKQVLALDPAYADTQSRLLEAEEQQKAERLFNAARASFAQGHWKLAAQRSESVLALNAKYPGAPKLHARAVLRTRLRPVFEQALAQANAGHWQRTRTLVRRVLREDTAYPGARKLLARAQAALAARAARASAQTPAPAPTSPARVYTPPAPAPAPTPPPP